MARRALDRHRGGFGEVENHLLRAWSRFGGRARNYGQDLVDRTALYLGIARAARAHSAGDLSHASGLMVNALDAGAAFPPYLIDAVVDGLDLGAPEDLARFAEALLKASGSEGARCARPERDGRKPMPRSDRRASRARQGTRGHGGGGGRSPGLLERLPRDRLLRRREDVLDRLETLAVREIGTAEFEALLSDDASYQPAWEPTDAKVAPRPLPRIQGRHHGSLRPAWTLGSSVCNGERLYTSAAGLLGYLRSIGLPDDHLTDLTSRVDCPAVRTRRRFACRQSLPTPAGAPVEGAECCLSAETSGRRRVRAPSRMRWASRSVNVQVTFIHPGWSGNWCPWLEKTKAELERHDAVVLMRFMRTHLGRQIRKRLRWESLGAFAGVREEGQ